MKASTTKEAPWLGHGFQNAALSELHLLVQTREAQGEAEDLESIPGSTAHLLGFLKRRLLPSLCTIYPFEQAGWPKCSLKLAQLEGSVNLSPSAWLAFAIQTHQPGAQGARVPHFLLSSPNFPGSVGFISPHRSPGKPTQRPGPCCSLCRGAQAPPVPGSKFLHCLGAGGGGG